MGNCKIYSNNQKKSRKTAFWPKTRKIGAFVVPGIDASKMGRYTAKKEKRV